MTRFLGASEDRVALTRAWERETRHRATERIGFVRRLKEAREAGVRNTLAMERDRDREKDRANRERYEAEQRKLNLYQQTLIDEAERLARHAEDLRQEALGCYFCEMCKRYIPVSILERHVASCATYFQGS